MTNNKTRYIIIFVKNKANILEGEQNMKVETIKMNNKQVYILGKAIKKVVDCQDYDKVRSYRKMIRSLRTDDMISCTQRNYLTGLVLKFSKSSCVKHFYLSPSNREYK